MTRKVLFISFKHSEGVLDGGGMENLRCFRLLQDIFGKENVDTFYMRSDKRDLLGKVMAVPLFFKDYFYGVTPRKMAAIVGKAAQYDYVFLSSSLFGIIARELKAQGYTGKIISHFHNVEKKYYSDLLSRSFPLRNIVVRCAEHNDKYAWLYSDKTIVLNERDHQILRQSYSGQANAVLPISVADKYQSTTDSQTLTRSTPYCLFLGSYFPPNVQAVRWFVENVLPHVNIKLKIVGKGMSQLRQERLAGNLEIVSDAPDLIPYFREADFVVLPIFSGSGMKVKTCEALMHGKNIIATDEAFEGYNIDGQKVGARCNTAEEFIATIKQFSAHPIPKLNAYSRETYLQHFSEKATADIFRNLFT